VEAETAEKLRLIDEQYTRAPFYGIRKMGWWLSEQGYAVNAKRVRRLMRQMGLEAKYPKPRLSVPGAGHKIYPYRRGGLKIDRPDHVWASDSSVCWLWVDRVGDRHSWLILARTFSVKN
jgi:putative transposase